MGKNITQYAQESGIPYEEIDYQMIPLIMTLNQIGFETQYCCWGHERTDDTYIVFSEKVKDEHIIDFLNFIIERKIHSPFSFNKWTRIREDDGGNDNYIAQNWVMKMNIRPEEENDLHKFWSVYNFISNVISYSLSGIIVEKN